MFARQEFPALKTQYIDTGKVRWVFRHAPISSHDRARPAATAVECAHDQGQYDAYHTLIYATTDLLGKTVLTDAQLKQHADTLGLDRSVFDACLAGDSKTLGINEDLESATALGVPSTPGIFVDSELVTGPKTAEEIGRIIDCHLDD